jgi:hypothetical protein
VRVAAQGVRGEIAQSVGDESEREHTPSGGTQ